jgi:hypothetical protein
VPRLSVRHPHADHAHAVAQEAVHGLGEVRQLVDQQHMDLGALVFVDVLLVLAVAQEDLRAVGKANLVRDDLAPARRDPGGEQRAKALRAFHMVLREVVAGAAEQVDLQSRDVAAPRDRTCADQEAFAASRGAAIQDLGRGALERDPLLLVQDYVERDRLRRWLSQACRAVLSVHASFSSSSRCPSRRCPGCRSRSGARPRPTPRASSPGGGGCVPACRYRRRPRCARGQPCGFARTDPSSVAPGSGSPAARDRSAAPPDS